MEEKPEKKRRMKRNIIFFIIILLAVHIILLLIRIPIVTKETVEVSVMNSSSDIEEIPRAATKQQCEKTAYLWNYTWEGYDESKEGYVSPRYKLYNYEDRSGTFYVQFIFFDQSEHSFSDYQDMDYEKAKNTLPWSEVRMKSENLSVFLNKRDSRLIVATVKKADAKKAYWTYGIVTAPKISKCINIEVDTLENQTSNHHFEYINLTREMTHKEYARLWDIIVLRLKALFGVKAED